MKATIGAVFAACVLVSGCSKAPETVQNSTETPVVATAQPTAVETSVPECDEYLTKVMACVKDKVPEAQRKMIEDGIAQSKASWAAVPDKAQLAATCKQALDQAKASYGAMGCTF